MTNPTAQSAATVNQPLVMGLDSIARLHSLTLDQLRRRINANTVLKALLVRIGGQYLLPVDRLARVGELLATSGKAVN